MSVTKAEAAALFQRHHLEGLPAYRLRCDEPNPGGLIGDVFPLESRVTLRACGEGEDQNLPRLVGCTVEEATTWLDSLTDVSSVLVQPYDDLIFSVELVVTEDVFVAEVIPGIWELDNQVEPLTMTLAPGQEVCLRLQGPVAAQPARFWHEATGSVFTQYANVEDWQISDVTTWVGDQTRKLQQLRDELGTDIGIKLHYARRFGLSPQNIHTEGLAVPEQNRQPMPPHVPLVTSVHQELPRCATVKLAIGIAREEYAQLRMFAAQLQNHGVETVYVRSGLLSHMAITLRQQGFTVRRW